MLRKGIRFGMWLTLYTQFIPSRHLKCVCVCSPAVGASVDPHPVRDFHSAAVLVLLLVGSKQWLQRIQLVSFSSVPLCSRCALNNGRWIEISVQTSVSCIRSPFCTVLGVWMPSVLLTVSVAVRLTWVNQRSKRIKLQLIIYNTVVLLRQELHFFSLMTLT